MKAASTAARLRSGRLVQAGEITHDPDPEFGFVARVGQATDPADLCANCVKKAEPFVAYSEIEAPTGKVHYEDVAGHTLCGRDSSEW